MSDVLQQVRDLQLSDKSAAEALLLTFTKENLPLHVVSLELTPLAVSLNSFNGFMTLQDGQRLFFKSHTETDTVINEYYNAELLANAGYPVIQPVFQSTEPGKQFLAYEVIDDLSVFDVAWAIETGEVNQDMLAALTIAQNRADDDLLRLYEASLQTESSTNEQSPIHQLFYHRLVHGRLERFYGALPGQSGEDTSIHLPDGKHLMSDVRSAKWLINGRAYEETLDKIISRAIDILNPANADDVTIIGHGDAHNGNVFFRQADDPPSLLYFDPAFAGKHHPLLDLTKPLFHNVFAMWMYFSQEKQTTTDIAISIKDDIYHVDYDYELHPVREMFWQSKIERTLEPILKLLKERDLLRDDWREYLKAALFCCPFLTMNLADNERFPPEISLLGLCMSVEMGSYSPSDNLSLLDRSLSRLADRL